MDKVRKPSNSLCYTPSSEPSRIYHRNSILLVVSAAENLLKDHEINAFVYESETDSDVSRAMEVSEGKYRRSAHGGDSSFCGLISWAIPPPPINPLYGNVPELILA
jgi:hypothetical protein